MIILKTTQFSSVQVILDKHAQNKSRIEFNFLRISSFDLYPPPLPNGLSKHNGIFIRDIILDLVPIIKSCIIKLCKFYIL